MRYFIDLSFCGTAYHGWQNQPNARTVQEVLETALSTLLRSEIAIVGAGRTDTGVHAELMVAHFDFDEELDPAQMVYKLNAFLPKDIAVSRIYQVKADAHARFDANSRTYIYRITRKKNPFLIDKAYLFKLPLDIEKMNEASKKLLEHKNFKCFSRSKSDVKTYHCDIEHAEWQVVGDELVFVIQANRFLRNMVRAIVGTLLEIGQGKLEISDMDKILSSEDRTEAGPSAPAHGLYLSQIMYPESIIDHE